MNIELENQFFGAFIAFWVVKILEAATIACISNLLSRIFATLSLFFVVSFVVILLRRSIYSSSPSIRNRIFFHVINVICSMAVYGVLQFFNPGLFNNSDQGIFLSFVLVGTIAFWIIVSEINRQNIPEIIRLTQEYNHLE